VQTSPCLKKCPKISANCCTNNIIKCFNEEVKASKKITDLLFVLFTTFYFCAIFIVKVYAVLIKVYTVLSGKVGSSKKSRLLGGSEMNRLLNGVEKWSRRQRHRRCSN